MINYFHFSKNTLSFSKCSLFSKCAFILGCTLGCSSCSSINFNFHAPASFSTFMLQHHPECSSYRKCAFILKNVKTVWKVSWVFFHLSEKHNCKQKSADFAEICIVTSKSFTDEVVLKRRNIYKALEFVSVVGNL